MKDEIIKVKFILRSLEKSSRSEEVMMHEEAILNIVNDLMKENERLRGIEQKAIEQSREIQSAGLSPVEATKLKKIIFEKEEEISFLYSVITKMRPLWITAMDFAEHGTNESINRIRYYQKNVNFSQKEIDAIWMNKSSGGG